MEKSIHSAQYAIFLKIFRQARKRVGLTQTQLAHRVGATQTFISKCERGERRIDIVELRTFCKAFGWTLGQFVRALEKALSRRQK